MMRRKLELALINRLSGWVFAVTAEARKQEFFGKLLAAEFFPERHFKVSGFWEQCLLSEFRKRYNPAQPDPYFRDIIRKQVWGGSQGKDWHLEEAQDDAGLDKYGTWRKLQTAQIRTFLQAHPEWKTLVEIGCGNGIYLDYLSRQLGSQYQYAGIDLSEEQIQWNRLQEKYKSLQFFSGAAGDPLPGLDSKSILYLTFGTLSCMTESELTAWLQQVRRESGLRAISIAEWNVDYNPEVETTSRAMSPTLYNHSYVHLLKQNGYTIEMLEYADATGIFPGHVRTLVIAIPS